LSANEAGTYNDPFSQDPTNTDRITRTLINAPFCRTFLRSVFVWVIDPQRMVTDRHVKYRPRIDRLEMSRFAGLFLPASYCGRCGRYSGPLY
jgi:hypothetical protein